MLTRSSEISFKAYRSTVQKIVLRPLEEIVGNYKGFEKGSWGLLVSFDTCQTIFSLEPEKEELLAQKLSEIPVGTKIGILMITDDRGKRVLIRRCAVEDRELTTRKRKSA